MYKNLIVLLTITVIVTFACETDDPCKVNNLPENSSNNKPEINNIFISPIPAKTDVWIYLTAVAIDKDGDNLTYFWSCSSGEFFPDDTKRNPARWKVMTTGNYTITCTVSDGKDTSDKSISITVM